MKPFRLSDGQTDDAPFSLRTEPRPGDRSAIKKILSSTDLFYSCEIDIAVWLLNEAIRDGDESGYYFLFADKGKETVGYICYGPITLTENRFDIYWIAVRKDLQGNGLGGLLIREGEKKIGELGGKIAYVETSSRKDYRPTRAFYKKHRYLEIARLPDFYRDGDDKIILMKKFS